MEVGGRQKEVKEHKDNSYFKLNKTEKIKKLIIGSEKITVLISAPKKYMVHIHVSRLSPSASADDVLKFLEGNPRLFI